MKPRLVDSSVWIDLLGGRTTWATDRLRVLIDQRLVLTVDLIIMEVLQGVRHPRELRDTDDALSRFECRTVGGPARTRRAAANYRLLRSVGITPRSPIDVLIATFCVDEDCELLASARDYALMVPHLGLELHQPSLN